MTEDRPDDPPTYLSRAWETASISDLAIAAEDRRQRGSSIATGSFGRKSAARFTQIPYYILRSRPAFDVVVNQKWSNQVDLQEALLNFGKDTAADCQLYPTYQNDILPWLEVKRKEKKEE